MKILFHPASGRWANQVAYQSRYGQALRNYVIPRNGRTAAQQHVRRVFGSYAQMWGRKLSKAQQDLWNFAGPQVMSHPRLGQRGPLTGEQHFEQINCVLACVDQPPVWEPPARVVFGLNPVGELVITNGEDGVRLLLSVTGPMTEDIMVFGQAPCSAGRNKRRNVSYLGLLSAPKDGLSEVTDIYKAKYGEPKAGTKVFIVTCQQKDGWKGIEQETSEVVPGRPEGQQAASETANSQQPYMYKGCIRGAQGTDTIVASPSPGGAETEDGGGKAAGAALEGRKVPGEEGDAPV